jgi:FkbM family methyltransferase
VARGAFVRQHKPMIKSLAKKALVALVNALPVPVQRAAIERAAARIGGYELFQSLGRGFGVKDIRIAGRYGLIEGSIDDESILARYGQARIWASETNRLFVDFFDAHSGGTYLDVGANIGLTTIPIARNARVSCFAFEPEPDNYGYLEHNIRRNCRQGNVEIRNLALFDRQTTVDFELSQRNRGDHRIRIKASKGAYAEHTRALVRIAANKLDTIIDPSELRLPLAVKIDTQGAECHVFAGGQRTLSRAELIAFEYWPYGIRRTDGDVNFLADFISRHFSRGALVNGDRDESPAWQPIKTVVDQLGALWRSDNTAYCYRDVFVRK